MSSPEITRPLTWLKHSPEWADAELMSLLHLAVREHRNDDSFWSALQILRALHRSGYRIVKDCPVGAESTPEQRELDAVMSLGPSLTPRTAATSAPELVREAYCAGYQDAVDALRRWAKQFAAEPLQGVFHSAAKMIEMAKPT